MKRIIGKIKKYKPTSPGRRNKISIDRSLLHKKSSMAALTIKIKKTGYRNHFGRLTVSGRSGKNQHRRKYRLIDFRRRALDELKGYVQRIEYDPNRTAFIALVKYDISQISEDRLKYLKKLEYIAYKEGAQEVYHYILASEDTYEGQLIMSGDVFMEGEMTSGSTTTLEQIPTGNFIHNIEYTTNSKSACVRSAGAFAILVGKANGMSAIKLPSGEIRRFNNNCRTTIGKISNINNKLVNLGKAGAGKRKGRKSTTRGVAMNPVDHHNGGRTHGGKSFGNFKGNMRKGQKTRRKKFSDKFIIRKRVRKGRK